MSPLDIACALLTWIKELLINHDTVEAEGRVRVDGRTSERNYCNASAPPLRN
jgi:hypothetical protein